MIKVVGHRVRGQTRSTVLIEWSNKKATITSNIYFRYYRGAGWVVVTRNRMTWGHPLSSVSLTDLGRRAIGEAR